MFFYRLFDNRNRKLATKISALLKCCSGWSDELAKQFYANFIGFEVVREHPMGPEQKWVELAPKGAATSITLVTWFESMPPGSVQGLVLDTDDIDSEHQVLSAKGLEISEVKAAPWGKYATFSDPDNNGWVLQETAG